MKLIEQNISSTQQGIEKTVKNGSLEPEIVHVFLLFNSLAFFFYSLTSKVGHKYGEHKNINI